MNIETAEATRTEIFSSTGKLGILRRQDNRLYVNSRNYLTNTTEAERNLNKVIEIAQGHPQISRCVARGLVNEQVKQALESSFSDKLGVILPVEEFTGDKSYYVYVAENKPGRNLITPIEEMIDNTKAPNSQGEPLTQRARSIINSGYTFIEDITDGQEDQVYRLWGETFGWKRDEVDNLRNRLTVGNQSLKSAGKDIWFSAIQATNGEIICVAMAERLSIPSARGWIDLVESTEWLTKNGYKGKGFMTANLGILNAQILSDFPNSTPLIYAECNYQSRSDRAGYGAGFRIPDRKLAPQILVQNVSVNDGEQVGEGKLRDFTFMYLPVESIRNYYSPEKIYPVMQMIKALEI